MRPLTLRLTAFGPYKDTEIIDFTKLKEQSIFVISGNTGAGKTTIFDGICFALYGSASGQDRENQTMLRSHFAEDDIHTAVELIFELHHRTYRILRQLGHVKQGNKTKTGERYEFFEMEDDREVPCVDRQIVSEIDKKVESLLGLTQAQFKQIVMLPQGEFRKLLTSQTENKEDILRRLFKTDRYQQIGEKLRNRKKRVEEMFQQEERVKASLIQNVQATLPVREGSLFFQVISQDHYNTQQILQGLEDEVAYYQEKKLQDHQQYEQAYKRHTEKQAEFYQAQALNEKFVELTSKRQQLQQLAKQLPVFAQKETQWELAERASTIEPYEQQVKEWREEEEKKRKAYEQAVHAKKQIEADYQQTLKKYQQEEGKEEKREQLRRELTRLQDYLPTVKEIDQVKQQIQVLEQQVSQAHTQLEAIKQKRKEKADTVEKWQQQIMELEKRVSKYPEKNDLLAEKREQWKVLHEYHKYALKQTSLDQELQQKKQVFEQKKSEYLEQEKNWFNQQALVLASHLHDGEACPVCGSLEHPKKAADKGGMISKEQLETFKKTVEHCEHEYHALKVDWTANTKQLQDRQDDVEVLDLTIEEVPMKLEQLKKEGKVLSEEVEKLKSDQRLLAKWKSDLDGQQQELKQFDKKKDELEELYQEKRLKAENTKTLYMERIRTIPEELRVLKQLETQMQNTKKEKIALEQAWEQVQQQLQNIQDKKTKAISNVESTEREQMDTIAKRKKMEATFQSLLQKSEFATEELYRSAKMSEEARAELKNEIQQFKQTRSFLEGQVKELEISLQDKEEVNLQQLQQQLEEFKQAYETALNQWEHSKKIHVEAIQLRDKITEAEKRVRESERQLAVLTDLFDVIRGQNQQKVSFERYLQIDYLEQIIEAANLRLKKLSNGQYDLIRSDRQESHGRQSGLALDIYDAYTGQTRDVKTLSGGEKFNASLCLALGMSDVIQSFQGNISIETMFIDEGFGTLDEEALNKAIDALVDLQQLGRMIGVISHVQELKSIFPAILEVKKTKEGHSQAQFILK
ncbi:SbcC/MukB-like Walker B domain-containing protein [Bacillus sp. SD088]|uniref:SbcC/MukB-like Walker B domain-containing protein n=1 Tax=Bacillus sp. SD088 TaxID=2782012 RepID=UPI001A95F87B|nr:SMC family ATPase [Bacillus sp. SD088]MBO0995023.1 SMC family ATPase [Bacillus sp. SD088]